MKGKNVYVFDADLLHQDAIRKVFGNIATISYSSYIARGYANNNGKIDKSELDYLFHNKNKKQQKEILEIAKKGNITL